MAAVFLAAGCDQDVTSSGPAGTPAIFVAENGTKQWTAAAGKSTPRMENAVPGANTLIDGYSPGLGSLEIQLVAQDSGELTRVGLRSEDGQVSGAIALPQESPADYSIVAYDREGRLTHKGEGTTPALAQLDKPVRIPLHPVEAGSGEPREGIVLTLSREGIALVSHQSPESPGEWIVSAQLHDARGEPLKVDPADLKWHLLDDRFLELRRYFDPFDINVVVKKEYEILELCTLKPVVTACLPNGLCKPLRVCDDPWRQISAGANHTCALTQSGAAYCWGANDQGQLGAQTTSSCTTNPTSPLKCHSRPLRVACPPGAPCQFTQISSGDTLTAALDVNGDLWWWGRGAPDHHRVHAVLAGNTMKFSQVTAGFGHACAIEQSRQEIWCWGANAFGEAGGLLTQQDVPDQAPVRVMVPLKFRKVLAGGEHTCAVGSTSRDVVCWGRDDQKQTSGPNSTTAPATGSGPFHFQQFGGLVSILDLAVSSNTTCVTMPQGVTCWGALRGLNSAPFGAPDQLVVGFGHQCALNAGQASCVGNNSWGELGIGSLMSQSTPTPVRAPPTEYVELSTGLVHTCGITPAGEAFCWGRNFSGELGIGSISYTASAPTQVVGP